MDTWQLPYASEILDISFNWNSNILIIRSNADGKLFLADPSDCGYLGEVDLPAGAEGFGVAISPSYPAEYYINSDTAPFILHSDGSGVWSELSNPAGTDCAGMDFEGLFGSPDQIFEVSATSPYQLYAIETDGSDYDVYALPGVNGEISGFMGHEIATLYGYPPGAVVLTTRFGHEFFFYYGGYTQYGQEPCPVPVSESLGLTWSPEGLVYWSYKGLDMEYYISALSIPIFGAIEDDYCASVSRTNALRMLVNPSTGSAGLIVDLLTPGQISLEVFDLSGRLVGLLHDGQLVSGESIFGFGGSPGVYTAVLRHSGHEERLRFVLTR
ncbi:MAG: T9SS type A sorting domain-containing protein [Candidatus Sabulitectum sp.]|nr:T9SS type A sorting domain-containing protein [Candidatus Sabulitectum sp.]